MIQKIHEEKLDSMNVYERVRYKSRNEIYDLDNEERTKLEDLLIEKYADMVSHASDEAILNLASDKGLILE